ncbi:hypothetical protein D3C78_954040 [compost metagenome]
MQHLGDFAVGQAFDIGEKHRFALGLGQGIDAADDLRCQHVGLRHGFSIERQGLIGVYLALPLAHPPGADFVEPDRMQNAQQPMVHACALHVLPGPFQRPHAGGLHQVIGDMPLPGQQQAVAP